MNIVEVEVDNGILHLLGIDVLDLHRHLAASQLLTELGSIFQGVDGAIGIYATFETERSIGAESVTTS